MAFTAFSSFAFTDGDKKEDFDKRRGEIECATYAWDAADAYCAQRDEGCSETQLYIFADIAYSYCMSN